MPANAAVKPMKLPAPVKPQRTLALHLGEPPSANRYWRQAKGRIHLSTEARNYRGAVRLAYAKQVGKLAVMFPAGPVKIELVWTRGIKIGDLDNRIKQVLDALQGLAYDDDTQIEEIHAYRKDDTHNPSLAVLITGIPL